jgi:hypothetical protein
MRPDFELLTTHADRVFDPILEIEREALWYHFQYSAIHEVDSVLTDIERAIHVIFRYVESCDSDDTRLTGDIDVYS